MKITRDELVPFSVLNALTGTTNKEAQKRWLAENHIKFVTDIKGRPRIHTEEIKRILITDDVKKVVPFNKPVPNYAAI